MYNNKGIIELHCHTKMSEGRGLISPSELVKYAYDNGYNYALIVNNDIEFTDSETIKKLISCLEYDNTPRRLGWCLLSKRKEYRQQGTFP